MPSWDIIVTGRVTIAAVALYRCDNQPGVAAVRDSKDRRGPILAFSREDWRAFVRTIKDGRPDVS